MKKQQQPKRPGRPKIADPRPSVTLRLKPDQLEHLDRMAEENGTTRTALMQIAVARLLKEGL
jgi:uncharacterized protein (DUF1778 family)